MSAAQSSQSADALALRLQQQQLVASFGLFALRCGPLQQLLDEAARVAAEGLETKMAKVLRFRPETNDLLVVAGVGWHAGVVGNSTLGGGLDSQPGYTVHTGTPTLSNHLAHEQRFRVPALLAEHGVQSALNVVIARPDQVPYGVLEVDSTLRHDFVQIDTAFLQALANVLAAGLARLEAEEAKDALLQDKDLLMREVHHRVSNSLQLVRTMLGLQGRAASDETRGHLENAAGRIMSIAAVHRRLYQGGSVSEGDVALYLSALLDDMRDGVVDKRVIELDAVPMTLPADHLTPLGLIVTELVTNAIKHGAGRILVRVRRMTAAVEVCVEDEGQGLPDAVSDLRRGLGMRLIASLAKGTPVAIDRSVPFGRVTVTLKV